MTDNTNAESDMQKPVISNSQGGVPEAGVQAPTTQDNAEDTADQKTTTDNALTQENERLEKERKQLARINAKSGERAKEAKLAALSAVAQLDKEKAKEFLSERPELEASFNEQYPDHFTEKKEVTLPTPSEKQTVNIEVDRELLKAEILADTAKAATLQEQESTSMNFAIANGLKAEDQQALKKVASALVSADPSTSFNEALSIVYQNKFGKAPVEQSVVLSGGVSVNTPTPQEPTPEQINFWKENISSQFTDEMAREAQKGADEFYKTMTRGSKK